MPAHGPCPSCSGQLVQVERSGVRIDACRQCRGVFLDRGELDQILERERSYVQHTRDDDEEFLREISGKQERQQSYGFDKHTAEKLLGDFRSHKSHSHKHKKKKSFLDELFDEHRGDYGLLALGVLGASTSPPLIAACAAPALAIAFWRTGAAALVLAPFALRVGVRPSAHALRLALLAGVMLAVHFGTFIPSLSYTSVASAAALVCSQAVWAALFGRIMGERMPARAWLGVGLAFTGVLVVTGVDVSLDSKALAGDALALCGGVFGGAYIVTGGFVRRELDTSTYTTICYGSCGALLLVVCLLSGSALGGYAAEDWLRVAAITVLGQLVGHSLFNFVLRSISPTIVSLSGLFTVPLAAIIAAIALDETPPAAAIPAMVLLVAGTALVINARSRAASVSS